MLAGCQAIIGHMVLPRDGVIFLEGADD
jgi:hypothetical protein